METGNLGRQEVGGTLLNTPETWKVRHSQDSKKGTLDEMPSSRKTGHQMKEGIAIPQSQL